ncbi:MAG: lysylphosphatidylglycerol synthase transmembrane domain-containing protein [Polyangiaceae bacterium]
MVRDPADSAITAPAALARGASAGAAGAGEEGNGSEAGTSASDPLLASNPLQEATNPAKRTPLWKRIAPFVVAIALLAFVLARTDLAAVRASLSRVHAPGFIGFAALFVVALLSADTFATLVVYRPVLGRIRYRDLFTVRGASYLPSILNHHVGQAFVTLFLSRSHGVPLARVAGGTLIVYASWAACLLVLASAALVAGGLPTTWLLVPLGAGVAYLVLLAIRPRALEKVRLFAPLFEAGVRGHLTAAAARIPHAAVMFLGTWLELKFFGVDVPVDKALAFMPILMVAVTLPITPQGFGTRDVLAATLFLPYAAGATGDEKRAAIAAATASWGAVLTAIEALLGLLLLRRATLLLSRGAEAGSLSGRETGS